MAGKHLACPSVTSAGAEAGIDHGVLDVLVPQPIPAKGYILAGVQDVGGDGVLQGMELPLVSRYARRLRILPHQPIQGTPVNGELSIGGEKGRELVGTFPEVRPD
jgi:hypothetical protein